MHHQLYDLLSAPGNFIFSYIISYVELNLGLTYVDLSNYHFFLEKIT